MIQVVGPGLPAPVTLPVSSNAVFAAGYLLFREGESLVARPFDDRAVRFTGPPVTLSDSVSYNPAVGGPPSRRLATSSPSGSKSGAAHLVRPRRQSAGVDRRSGRDSNPSLAPDRSGRIGIDRWDPSTATSRCGLSTIMQKAVQLTHAGRERFATWSRRRIWIAYWFRAAGPMQIRRMRSNGSGGEETLVTGTR